MKAWKVAIWDEVCWVKAETRGKAQAEVLRSMKDAGYITHRSTVVEAFKQMRTLRDPAGDALPDWRGCLNTEARERRDLVLRGGEPWT